ncbi:MAG: hypothetical protein WCK47_03655 [bacterium]
MTNDSPALGEHGSNPSRTQIMCLALATLAAVSMAAAPRTYPRPVGSPLHNPHMGWILIDNCYPTSIDAGRSLPYITDGTAWAEVDIVALLSDWDAVEPADNSYDWSLLDRASSFWASKGKVLKFRFSTDAMITNGRTAPAGQLYRTGCPWWIYDLGVASQEVVEWGFRHRVPDYANPIYMQKLSEFMRAFATHFQPMTPRLETVDLLGYGTWGEWHSGYDLPDMATRKQCLRSIIDAWTGAFSAWPSNTWLILSDSYEWRGEINLHPLSIYNDPRPTYTEFVENSAFDYGFSRPKIGVGRYGLGGFAKEGYDARHLRELRRTARRPMYGELSTSYQQFVDGVRQGYTPQSAIDEALMFGANYLTMLGWDIGIAGSDLTKSPVIQFYNGQSQGLMQYALLGMGYRLTPVRIEAPQKIVPGQRFSITHEWVNWANGRLHIPYRARFALVKDGGEAWAAIDSGFDTTNMIRGQICECESRFDAPSNLEPGLYDLRISLADAEGRSAIRLDCEGHDNQKRYTVACVEVGEGAPDPLPQIQGFESGSFAGSGFTPGSTSPGATTLTSAPAEIINGQWSVRAAFPVGTPATVVFKSDPAALTLSAASTYRVTFRYKLLGAQGGARDDAGYMFFRARSASGGDSTARGIIRWQDETGTQAAVKTVLFTLGPNTDYALEWGMHQGGVMTIDDIRITRIDDAKRWNDMFDTSSWSATRYYNIGSAASLSTDNPLYGTRSVLARQTYDPPSRSPEWTDFMRSDTAKLPLKRNTCYTVTFAVQQRRLGGDTDMLTPAPYGSHVYFLARTAAGGTANDAGMTQWYDQPGEFMSRKTVTFVTGACDDYYLLWGLRNGGCCAIDDITVVENGAYVALHSASDQVFDDFSTSRYIDSFDAAKWDAGPYNPRRVNQDGSGRMILSPPAADWEMAGLAARTLCDIHSTGSAKGTRFSVTIDSVNVTRHGTQRRGGIPVDSQLQLFFHKTSAFAYGMFPDAGPAFATAIYFGAGKAAVEMTQKDGGQPSTIGRAIGYRTIDVAFPLTVDLAMNDNRYELSFNSQRVLGGVTCMKPQDYGGRAGFEIIAANVGDARTSIALSRAMTGPAGGWGFVVRDSARLAEDFHSPDNNGIFMQMDGQAPGAAFTRNTADGKLSITPGNADWAFGGCQAANLFEFDPATSTAESFAVETTVNAISPSSGRLYAALVASEWVGNEGAAVAPSYFNRNDATVQMIMTAGAGGQGAQLEIYSKPKGRAGSNGTLLLSQSLPLSLPAVLRLVVTPERYAAMVNGRAVAGGQHTAAFSVRTIAGAYGVGNQAAGRGDIVFSRAVMELGADAPEAEPCAPAGWSGPLVIAAAPGQNASVTTATNKDILYASWAVTNSGGVGTTTPILCELRDDGATTSSWTLPAPLQPAQTIEIRDQQSGPLALGTHALELVIGGAVAARVELLVVPDPISRIDWPPY